jgi:hypothetical protein
MNCTNWSKCFAIPLALGLCLGTLCVPKARAQVSPNATSNSPTVSVNFVTTPATPLNPGFNGFNGNMKNAVEYYDANFQRFLIALSPGWLRFPGGTDSEAFNWASGEIVSAWVDRLAAKQYTHDINAAAQPIVAGKGGASFSDFAALAANVGGAKIIVSINAYTDTPQSAQAFARYALLASALPAQSPAVNAALATGSYFPLDVGDRWVYRIDDRMVTGSYQTWRVDRTETQNGLTYSVVAIEGPGSLYYEYWFTRTGPERIYLLSGDGQLHLFCDFSGQQAAGAELQPTGNVAEWKTSFGTFQDAVTYSNLTGGLILENGTLVRGMGLVTSTATMLSGSSGGFTQGRTLVEATVAGGIHFPAPVPSVQLGMESLSLDVSGQKVTNCAVPCYFVACGLVPGADPPGTYKPCAQARVGLANWPAGASRAVRVQFVAPDGTTLFDQTLNLDGSPTESVTFIQVPLYSAPNQGLPPGLYQLLAKTADGAAQSALAVQIQ